MCVEALGDLSVYEPDYLISLEQYHVVVANMMKITQDPGIAFSLSDLANPNDFGIVGYAMISAATLRESLDISQKYSSSLMGQPLRIDTIRETSPGFEKHKTHARHFFNAASSSQRAGGVSSP